MRSSSKALSKFLVRFLVLALHDDTGRDVRQADRRVGRIDRLSAGARSAEDILADVVHRDFYVELLGFGQHGHRSGRGVDAALRFGLGYALHAMYARFVFERTIDIVARDFHHDLLVSAGRAFREGGDFVLPAFGFDVFGVHAHQVAGEDGGFVAARAAADLDDRVFRILRVLGNQQEFDLLFEGFDLRFQFRDLPACHFAHLLVLVVGQDVFGFGQVGDGRAVAFRGFDDRFQAPGIPC